MKKIYLFGLVLILVVTFAFYLASKREISTQLFNTYRYSQYCLSGYRGQHGWDKLSPQYSLWCGNGDEFKGNIDDPNLYTLSGILYSKLADPSSINPESQPLGKYLFGFSNSLFGTPLIIQYLSFFVILICLYYASKQILPFYLSFLAPALFILDLLAVSELKAPYLDLVSTACVMLFLSFIDSPRAAMVILGLAALSKSFSTGFVLSVVLFFYLFIKDRKNIFVYFKYSWLALIVYLTGYAVFFFYHHNPLDFVTLHIDILKLYHSYVPEYPKGEIFRIIFTGKWKLWFDGSDLVDVPEWTILWPFSTLSVFVTLFVKKLHSNLVLLPHLLWVMCYLGFISLRLVFPRYLIPVLPSLYIILSYIIQNFYVQCKNILPRRS